MIPLGRRASSSDTGVSKRTISEYTRASRTRRAISWAYWPPKSTTRTVSGASGTTKRGPGGARQRTGPGSVPHPHTLGALQCLALGLQGGGHHDFGLLEFLDRR